MYLNKRPVLAERLDFGEGLCIPCCVCYNLYQHFGRLFVCRPQAYFHNEDGQNCKSDFQRYRTISNKFHEQADRGDSMGAQRYEFAIVGAGASGLMAAGETVQAGSTIVLEAKQKPGKKLLATGNGRCNLGNRGVSPTHYHGDVERASRVLERFSPEKLEQFWRKNGLLCRELDEGRLYPYGMQAVSVLECLLRRVVERGGEVRCDFPVEEIRREQGFLTLSGPCGRVRARRVILACGGMASPSLGGGELGYRLAKSLGHQITPLFPSLVQLTAPSARVKPLKGARSLAEISLWTGSHGVASAKGEVQFTGEGLSGICVFEVSRAYGELSEKERKTAELSICLMPEYGPGDLYAFLRTAASSPLLPAQELLDGLLNRLVAREVLKSAVRRLPAYAREYKPAELSAIATRVRDFRFPVTGTAGWQAAQVTAGGVPLSEVDISTLESRLCSGVYLTGELLNLDGDCGGYNLHWAWATGLLAGRSAGMAANPGTRWDFRL